MTALATKRLSYEDYLALDAASEQRLEFWSGEVWAMAGGYPRSRADQRERDR